jgi:hypothetical protein
VWRMPSSAPGGFSIVTKARQSRDRPVSRGRSVDVRLLCQRTGRFALYDLPRSPRPTFEQPQPLRGSLSVVPSIRRAIGLPDLARRQVYRLPHAATRDPRKRHLHRSLDSQTHPSARRSAQRRGGQGALDALMIGGTKSINELLGDPLRRVLWQAGRPGCLPAILSS